MMQGYRRRTIRLQGYDYSQPGMYFVTICVQRRACLFGEVVDGTMRLNDAGRMIKTTWDEIPDFYPGVNVDAMIVMPNHLHGIITLVGAAPRGRPDAPRGPIRLSLPEVVQRFKTLTTKRYIDEVNQSGWPPFAGRLWQRNYYEHIIRTEEVLNRIRRYICTNPARWAIDQENPAVRKSKIS